MNAFRMFLRQLVRVMAADLGLSLSETESILLSSLAGDEGCEDAQLDLVARILGGA